MFDTMGDRALRSVESIGPIACIAVAAGASHLLPCQGASEMDERSRRSTGSESPDLASHRPESSDEDVFRALSDHGDTEDAELLEAIKARVRRSIDDPRPSLSLHEIDGFIDGLVVKARLDGERA